MSLAAACGWAFFRSLSIALLGLPLCWSLASTLRTLPSPARKAAWVTLLLPFFTPDLVVGYAFSNFSLSLIRHPVWNEVLYAFLILLKVVPVGTLAICIWPPAPISAEALHCHRLALSAIHGMMGRLKRRIGMTIRGPARNLMPAAAVMFLLAFQEFEIASLMGTVSWTVWLFDAQVGGLFLADSLRHALLPVICLATVLVPVLLLAIKSHHLVASAKQPSKRPSAPLMLLLACYLLGAAIALCGIPFAIAGRGAIDGCAALWGNSLQTMGLAKEILRGLSWGLVSGIGAYCVAAWFLSSRIRTVKTVGAVVVSLPGLFGSLVLSLVLLSLFQLEYLNAVYDTPLPLTIGLLLFLLPRALILQLLLKAVQPRERLHLAALLKDSPAAGQGRELVWHLRLRGHFWSMVLLTYWGYLDLTVSSLLAPVAIVSAPVRMYNLMHYGRSAVLSAMTCVAIIVPLFLFVVLAFARRRLLRVFVP